jgi:hypothetical protein
VLVVVLANDVDVDSPILDVTRIVQGAAHGKVQIQSDDSILYEPMPGFHGTDAFIYEVCDPVLCDTAVVLITVLPVNDPPVAADDAVTTQAGSAVIIPVLDNDSDVDGDALAVRRIVFPPQEGAVQILAMARPLHPGRGTSGLVVFATRSATRATYRDVAEVRVTVGDNDPPRLVPDQGRRLGQAITLDVLANDEIRTAAS